MAEPRRVSSEGRRPQDDHPWTWLTHDPPTRIPASTREQDFLEGPRRRLQDLWEVMRIAAEYLHGLRSLHFIGPCVTVFGSARVSEDAPYYALGQKLGKSLAEAGFTVMTGGGPGLMEAANRGAYEAGGLSIGCNIVLPHEQHVNEYIDVEVTFEYFSVRKTMLRKYSYAFLALPGGFGTLDELFETVTLIQTGKIAMFPVILLGIDYWKPLLDFVVERMAQAGMISIGDTRLLHLTDSPEEATALIMQDAERRFGPEWRKVPRPLWILGERRPKPRPA